MKILIFLFIAIEFTRCNQKTDVQRLIEFINDPSNKITQKITIGGVEMISKWLPASYRDLELTRGTVAPGKRNDDDTDYCYFNVRFEKSISDKPDKDKVLYLDFAMQNDFRLLVNRDSMLPSICQKIENGRSGSYEYMIAFEKPKRKIKDDDFTLIYNDKIFSTGTVAFVYNHNDILKIPKLKSQSIQ